MREFSKAVGSLSFALCLVSFLVQLSLSDNFYWSSGSVDWLVGWLVTPWCHLCRLMCGRGRRWWLRGWVGGRLVESRMCESMMEGLLS